MAVDIVTIPLDELLCDRAESLMEISMIDKLYGSDHDKYEERRAVNVKIVERIEGELTRRNVVLTPVKGFRE